MLIKYLNPHEESSVKRRIREKSTDANNVFKPPEESIVKPRDTSSKPAIKVVPVKQVTKEY